MSSALISAHAKRNPVVERLVGATGEPKRVGEAARALATRVVPAIVAALDEILSFPMQIEVGAVDIVRFPEAQPKSPGHSALVIVPSASSPDALAIHADADAVALLVSALFGADPEMAATPITRRLSPIETELTANVFEIVATAFNGSGERSLDLKFPLTRPVCGADIGKLTLRDGPAARIELKLSCPAGFGSLRVTMPQRVLLEHRGEAAGGAHAATPTAWKARFGEEVMRSSVALEATVPLARMTLGEIATLQVGQIMELPPEAQANTRLSARRKTVFVCEFGKLGNHYTVRVRHPYDAGQEFIDGLVSR